MLHIMDVSRWQGNIDWDKVKASGKIDGVMLRAALSASKYGRLISCAITDETIGMVIQFFFDRTKTALKQ